MYFKAIVTFRFQTCETQIHIWKVYKHVTVHREVPDAPINGFQTGSHVVEEHHHSGATFPVLSNVFFDVAPHSADSQMAFIYTLSLILN